MRVYRDQADAQGNITTSAVYDIMEATYSGQDMGKRMITATIKSPTPIDFQLGDYVVLSMQSLFRNGNHGSVEDEKFYIYTEPQCKKTARSMSTGDAFETTVIFYPRQYELSCIQMRDFIQQKGNSAKIIYTGFDTVTFYGGAHELLERCMACMAQHYKDEEGNGLWSYELDPSLNEVENNALERYAFSFSGNSVMEALMKLNDKDFINTTFYINGRTIYVGKKRPFLCSVDGQGNITDHPLRMMYGKTSHMPINIDYGGLYDITKSVGEEIPITKLFAYGAARNLNRYYCSDRIHSGRFVNKLMLPSFSDDGETDYIISADSAKKYGINEGTKNFEEIYPSLRYMTYADIRGIKYCIKVRTSGLDSDKFIDGIMDHTNDENRARLPLARVQCYKVTPCDGELKGRNKLVECAPPEDLAVFIHATGKVVKVVLMADKDGETSIERQLAHDFGHVPTHTYGGTDYIPGACFAVHDNGFADMDGAEWDDTERENWFNAEFRRYSDTDSLYPQDVNQQRAELHRIEYVDTFWLTDLYVMEYNASGKGLYDNQRSFKRDGYSAWAWPRLNNESAWPDSLAVNEVVAVEPIVIADTSDNISAGRQQHWDIYLRDIGFAIDEQNDFGEMVFVFDTPVVSVLDGILEGREFTIDGGENMNDFQERIMCAYNEDGSFNQDFLFPGDSGNSGIPQQALLNGAVWRVRLNRNYNDSELSSVGLIIPNIDIQMNAGAHIVLLDIYMPDIYIRAAEQRLKREAIWYLEKNDKGNVKYAISFDKVRFNQIHNYALQMREGLTLRVQDEDLNIKSDNIERTLLNYEVPNSIDVPMYVDDDDKHIDEPKTTKYIFYAENSDGQPKFKENVQTENLYNGFRRLTFSLPKSDGIAVFDSEAGLEAWRPGQGLFNYENFECNDMIDRYAFSMDVPISARPEYPGESHMDVENCTIVFALHEKISYTTSKKTYPSDGVAGIRMPAICRDYVRFKAGKHYDVVVDLQVDENDSAWWTEDDDAIVLTTSQRDDTTRYSVVGYSRELIEEINDNGTLFHRYKYSFFLPDSFNERDGYYVGFYYYTPDNTGDTKTDFGVIRMVSVVEKDLDIDGNIANYVDFLVSSITIKIQDNTRPADRRVLGVSPEAIVDISAQIEEQTKATSWGALMNNVEKTRIESEAMKRTYEMLVNTARLNYQSLLNLKNNLFDPDGTCNDVFLQTMMLQVGADSMNYQLDYTYTTPTGVMNNFSVQGRDSQEGTYDVFRVVEEDHLHHFVYTQGAQRGTWTIPGSFAFPLAPDGKDDEGKDIWPVYYVCIRCKKDLDNDLSEQAWIVSQKQYAVNDPEDTDYWYFNWGILTADSNGHYTLQETRGNAYMYGDNIIAGKISTIAGNSYFDLTHGNFVLSEGVEDSPSLSYIDGKLTIRGVNDGTANSILVRLGLIEKGQMTNLWAIDKKKVIPVGHVGANIGYIVGDLNSYKNRPLTICFRIEDLKYYPSNVGAGRVILSVEIKLRNGTYARQQDLINITQDGYYYKNFELAVYEEEFIESICIAIYPDLTQETDDVSFVVYDGMVVLGEDIPSRYSPCLQHVVDAIHGSTEIAGGLTMTNLLMLKDTSTPAKVVAGMSGLPDDSTQTGQESYGVTLFSGGTYEDALAQAQAAAQGTIAQLQTLLPILLTKSGPGSRIGCFNVDTVNQVSIIGADGTSKYIFNTGDANTGAYMSIEKSGEEVIRITTDEIHPETEIFAFSSYEYSDRLKVFDINEDVTDKKVIIEQKDFTPSSLYKIQASGTVNLFRLKGNLYYEQKYSEKINLSFDIYLADKFLCSFSTTNHKSGEFDMVDYITVPSQFSYADLHGSTIALDIRNISISDGDFPGSHPALYLEILAFGTEEITNGKGNPDTWEDGEIRLYSDTIRNKTIIGRNGVCVTGSGGSSIAMLINNNSVECYAYGLPYTGNKNQVVRYKDSCMQIRNVMKEMVAGWESFGPAEQKEWLNRILQLLPDTKEILKLS